MSNLGRVLRIAFRSTVSNPQVRDHEAAEREIARGIVMRTATGSVRLQRGQYLAREEIDQRLNKVKGYTFDGRS